ncbi:helix-turn-helix domain-containing protein [Streptomyces sp. NPDC002825]|uniref:helix-turn-helix domain-containing protein n=1 Tax=Streptomyces sp. NPDC002825 TaxID=3154666 RepID=UPI0033177D83
MRVGNQGPSKRHGNRVAHTSHGVRGLKSCWYGRQSAQGVVKRAFKYRFFPTGEQAALLMRTFGCVRKVYKKGPPRAERTHLPV